jgi:hypothetical protein
MRLRMTFVEPFEWSVNVFIPKEEVIKFKTLDDLAIYIVDEYLYYKWVPIFDKIAEATKMPIEKREDAKIRYRLKMAEYVKKWLIEATLAKRG